MAKVFLDANVFIDLVERRTREAESLGNHDIFISNLSIHILHYIAKKKVPDADLFEAIDRFLLVGLDNAIAFKALTGPTNDFEDNVQLHSAAEADCDVLLTSDKKLLDMKFFGKVKIEPKLAI